MAQYQEAPGGGTKAIAYIASFFIPLVGVILFFMWRTNASLEYRTLGRNSLIVAIVGVVLLCLCYFIFGATIGLASLSVPTSP